MGVSREVESLLVKRGDWYIIVFGKEIAVHNTQGPCECPQGIVHRVLAWRRRMWKRNEVMEPV
jgi:hypothetical protein